ncbi:urea ABC transporter permease subunit UrtC [Synechococcus sp. CS-602]|uniref:urea ABC transporter permease subunit UrtC n=1 Tax=Synechococcaceae TaxID=1890426 RepID=UPI0008FF6C18|nr:MULTISPECIES: urea ABC transporter permease subunit UrtC [Synechococcaceae]MCT4365204.1 urea ABC transporter permease subunit UrtC [Candidatus Regnicoccus frigidus MAG-AL1]APD48038.1 urea ABC transporter permease subunit UrtC [Synechococcus sp. SynAce01]MCT0203079.1 urea ABC transporter permease subunit UrtC [Synechococcus sp. CS-603]MCT0204715.1 urea ABC transporter permease subunit UrtC [Synechococcus sp. CS-602]MCT0246137.1 urea ABC transporter permease subunit UrtC [Synechococcus sp. CS
MKLFKRLVPWILLAIALFVLPAILSDFRLNLFGRYFALAITALAIDLIWGYTGLLSLGQGIFFALGGYAAAMYLTLNTPSQQGGNGIPKFFENFGVSELPFFWQPFNSPFLTLACLSLIPALVAGVVGYLIFRNRIKGVYFSIITQAALMVFFHFFNGQQKLINGSNGLTTNTTELYGLLVGSSDMKLWFYRLTVLLLPVAFLICRYFTTGRFGDALIAIRDDEQRFRFAGFNPVPFKTIVFIVAGGLCGVSGALYTVQTGIVSPQFMSISFSIEMVIWVAVGGRGSLVGPIIGAVLVNYLQSLVSEALPELWLFVQGGLFIFVVVLMPDGIYGWFTGGGLRSFLASFGIAQKARTYPKIDEQIESLQEVVSTTPTDSSA